MDDKDIAITISRLDFTKLCLCSQFNYGLDVQAKLDVKTLATTTHNYQIDSRYHVPHVSRQKTGNFS